MSQSNIFAFFGKRKSPAATDAPDAGSVSGKQERSACDAASKRMRGSNVGVPAPGKAADADHMPMRPPTPKTAESQSSPRASSSLADSGGFEGYHAPGREPTTGTFLHNQAPFLTTDRRDAQRRMPDNPDFDPTTLYIPQQEMKNPKFKAMFTDMQKSWCMLGAATTSHSSLNCLKTCVWCRWEFKCQHFDAIIVMKVGKFYELYHMDAEVAVAELGLKWMGGGAAGACVAHCGFPEMSYSKYVSVLADRGYRLCRVEQMETPEMARERTGKQSAKVKRELCGIVSAGTCMDEDMLVDHRPRYLMSLTELNADNGSSTFGVCIVDVSTAAFEVGSFSDDMYMSRLSTLVSQLRPAEICFMRGGLGARALKMLKREVPASLFTARTAAQFWNAKRTVQELAGHGGAGTTDYFKSGIDDEVADRDEYATWPSVLQELAREHRALEDEVSEEASRQSDLALAALGGCISYLRAHFIDATTVSLKNFHKFVPYDLGGRTHESGRRGPRYMVLDSNSLANLEIMVDETGEVKNSLLGHLDHCVTPGGKRLFQKWLQAPLYQIAEIETRLDAVTELMEISDVAQNAAKAMKKFPDFERLLAKIHVIGSQDADHPMSRAIFYDDRNTVGRCVRSSLRTGFSQPHLKCSCLCGSNRTTALRTALAGFKELAQAIKMYARDVQRLHGGLKTETLKRLLCTTRDDEAELGAPGSNFPDLTAVVGAFEEKFSLEGGGTSLKPRPGVSEQYDDSAREIKAIETQLQAHLREVQRHLGCSVKFFQPNGNLRYQV
eukprot:SAG11_NODE_151_length_14583_cov_21.306200_19_plen_781_part_00